MVGQLETCLVSAFSSVGERSVSVWQQQYCRAQGGAVLRSLISSSFLYFCLSGEDEDQYEQFMLPLTAAFETVAQMFSTNTFNEQEAKVSRAGPSLLSMFSFI